MSFLIVCPKCKSKKIKIIQPQKVDSDFLFACENCKYERVLKNNETSRKMHALSMFYFELLSCWALNGELTPENFKDIYLMHLYTASEDGLQWEKELNNPHNNMQKGEK